MRSFGTITDASDVYRLFKQTDIDLSTGLTVLAGLSWYELEIENEGAIVFWGAFVIEVARRIGDDRNRDDLLSFDTDRRPGSPNFQDDVLVRLYRVKDDPDDLSSQYWYAHLFQHDWPKFYVGLICESAPCLAYPNNRPRLTLSVDEVIENLRGC